MEYPFPVPNFQSVCFPRSEVVLLWTTYISSVQSLSPVLLFATP